MFCFLTLECSMTEGSLALLECDKKTLNCLAFVKWLNRFNGKYSKNPHSDKLPTEIDRTLKNAGKKLSNLNFLAVGVGPGRWTGVRTAVNVIRSLSFCLNIPVYPVNSLRVCAEALLAQSQPIFVAINGFKNQVYFGEFHSKEEIEGKTHLLHFSDWCKQMESKQNPVKETKLFCISDLEDFYPLPQHLRKMFSFKKLYPNALNLAQIVFRQREQRTPKEWHQVQAFYLRTPLG